MRLGLVSLLVAFMLGAAASSPDLERSRRDRDRAVLEAVATYLLQTADGFGEPPSSPNPTVVLDAKPPRESPPFLCFDNCGSDGHRFSPSEGQALSFRNREHGDSSGVWRTVCSPCSHTLVLVSDLEKVLSKTADDPSLGKNRLMATWWETTFRRVFPHAKGWLQAFLPGYSVEGSEASFLGRAGPSPHGSIVRAHLHLANKAWVLDWCDITNFA
jgi:hypothetical protein